MKKIISILLIGSMLSGCVSSNMVSAMDEKDNSAAEEVKSDDENNEDKDNKNNINAKINEDNNFSKLGKLKRGVKTVGKFAYKAVKLPVFLPKEIIGWLIGKPVGEALEDVNIVENGSDLAETIGDIGVIATFVAGAYCAAKYFKLV